MVATVAWHRCRPGWMLLAVVLLAACSGPGGDSPSPADTVAASPPADASPTPVPAVEPREAQIRTTVTLESLSPTSWRLLGEPDELVAGPDAMWTKRANGTVDRIDPETGEITLSVDVMTIQGGWARCSGLGAGIDVTWACDDNEVVRLEPATGEFTPLGVMKVSDQLTLPLAFDRVWILEGDGSTLLGMQPTGPGPGDLRIPLGTRCVDVAAGLDALWIACPVDDVVLRVDPVAEAVDATTAGMTNPRWVAATARGAFVGFDGGLARLHPATGAVEDAVDVRSGLYGGIAATDDAVWVRTEVPFLRELDPETLEVVREITTDSDAGGAVALGFGSVWASAPDDMTIYRFNP